MESSPILVAAFYRFLSNPEFREIRDAIQRDGQERNLKGSVLLAGEGVNGTISGTPQAVKEFLQLLAVHLGTEPLEAKFSCCEAVPFRRWRVRLKKEIVTLKAPEADPTKQVGEYIEPKEWNALLQNPDVAVIDVRNDFEIGYGSFEGAINPYTDDFSEFPRFVEEHLPDKDQPVAMFCTGGIRCEKATSYLLAHGYRHVMHLRGGILRYLEEVPETESTWHGSCFVFDEREALDHQLRPIQTKEAC